MYFICTAIEFVMKLIKGYEFNINKLAEQATQYVLSMYLMIKYVCNGMFVLHGHGELDHNIN